MKYFKISNKGELDVRLISLMGGTTKANDPVKIGQFGTGLKYAISYLLRTKNNFRLFIGSKEVIFSTKPETIGNTEFEEIYCNGESMKISTHYGYQWQAWEAVREIWCNAKDEGGYGNKSIGEEEVFGNKGRTSFFIEINEEIQNVLDSWDKYFMSEKPLFDNNRFSIYLNTGETLKIYKNRILVKEDKHKKSLFNYDLKDCSLNELRQYIGSVEWVIAEKILSSNAEVVEHYLKNKKGDVFENKIDFTFCSYSNELVKRIFAGYLFLHPESSRSSGPKSVKVNKTLFDILRQCDLPTEKVYSQSGRVYGGGSYYEESDVEYSEVENPFLEKKIQAIANKYGSELQFELVQPKNKDFEVMTTDYDGLLVNSDVVNYSDADLEAIVLIGVMDQKGVDLYKALKRLIKFAQQSKSFEKILFGKEYEKINQIF